MNNIETVAKSLVEAWDENGQAKTWSEVRLASDKLDKVADFAKELGIWDSVYALANDIYHGRV